MKCWPVNGGQGYGSVGLLVCYWTLHLLFSYLSMVCLSSLLLECWSVAGLLLVWSALKPDNTSTPPKILYSLFPITSPQCQFHQSRYNPILSTPRPHSKPHPSNPWIKGPSPIAIHQFRADSRLAICGWSCVLEDLFKVTQFQNCRQTRTSGDRYTDLFLVKNWCRRSALYLLGYSDAFHEKFIVQTCSFTCNSSWEK